MLLNRFRLRARIGVGATLIALPLTVGQVTVGHAAATTWTCEAPMAWSTPNGIAGGTYNGVLYVGPGTCVTTDAGAVPFLPSVTNGPGYAMPYVYSGTCAEGVMSFANGNVGVFVAGTLIIEGQGGGTVGTTSAEGTPSSTPCTGGVAWWSGVGAEAGIR